MQFFFRNCTHILTRTQGTTFEDMFLIKIASKGTSLMMNSSYHSKSQFELLNSHFVGDLDSCI